MMLLGVFILLGALTSVFAPPPSASNTDDSALGALLASVRTGSALDMSLLANAFQPPPCLRECVDRMLHDSKTVENADSDLSPVCNQYRVIRACLAQKPACKSTLLDIGNIALQHFCSGDHEALGSWGPCVQGNALSIYRTCEGRCGMASVLLDAATLNTKAGNVLNLLDESGKKLLSIPDLHVICNSSTCFLSCMRSRIEEDCPKLRGAFLDSIIESVVRRTVGVAKPFETADTYANLISSILPAQCKYLKSISKDIMLTTIAPLTPYFTSAFTWSPTGTLPYATGSLVKVVSSAPLAVTPKPWTHAFEQSLRVDNRDRKLQCRLLDEQTHDEIPVTDVEALISAFANRVLNRVEPRTLDASDTLTLEDSPAVGELPFSKDHPTVSVKGNGHRSSAVSVFVSHHILMFSIILMFFHYRIL